MSTPREGVGSRVHSAGAAVPSIASTAELLSEAARPAPSAFGGLGALSRDEMNLAEFPLTVLSTRVDPKVKTLEFTDHLRLKNGELIERKWIITAADKFGLPTSTDDDVILGLIRLSMDDGFRDRKVYFTRYELLKALRWSTEGRSYSRLTKSLDRLSGVRIRATNSFYDNSSKSYQTCNFGIIDAYEINDHRGKKGEEAEPPKSFFIWSEMLFDSFRAGFIKKLDLELYFALQSAVSRRLYRYLDKHFYFKSTVEKPLMTLAFEKLGLSRNYRYVSSVRQQLEPAIEELIRIGFLSSYTITGKGEQATIRFTAASQTVLPVAQRPEGDSPRGAGAPAREMELPQSLPTPSQRSLLKEQLIEALVSRGITLQQARRLLETRGQSELEAIDRIIQYYDYLVETDDPKVSRSKVGFLYRAVESPYKFNVPVSFLGNGSRAESRGEGRGAPVGAARGPARAMRPEHRVRRRELEPVRAQSHGMHDHRGSSPLPEDDSETSASMEAYREFIDSRIARGVKQLGTDSLTQIHSQVEAKMTCLKSVLSAERFQEALNGCVKDELIRALSLPDYQSWKKSKPERL